MIFYFIGNLNGNRIAFRRVWEPILEYMTQPMQAVIFPVGNFGLGNAGFLDYVSRCVEGKCEVRVCGGTAAHEGWARSRPPVDGPVEARPGVFVQPYGSVVTFGKWRFCFLGRGSAFREDWFPLPKPDSFGEIPGEKERKNAIACIGKGVDVILSFLPPRNVAQSIFASRPEDDRRRRRLRDPMLAPLDEARDAAGKAVPKGKTLWWFSGGLGVDDDRKTRDGVRYVSVAPFLQGSRFVASIETIHPDEEKPSYEELGDFCL